MELFDKLMSSPWMMMSLGLVSHFLLKAMRVKDTSKRIEEKFSIVKFVRDYVVPLVFSVIASFIFTGISIDRGWPIWSAYFMSLSSSSALYNIYPVITNPAMWKSLASIVAGKATGQTPPPDDQQP